MISESNRLHDNFQIQKKVIKFTRVISIKCRMISLDLSIRTKQRSNHKLNFLFLISNKTIECRGHFLQHHFHTNWLGEKEEHSYA